MTYFFGLSGASWPPMSLATQNFPTIEQIIADWHVNQSDTHSEKNTRYGATPAELFKQIIPKHEAGFNVSIMDMLGRGLGYEFVGRPDQMAAWRQCCTMLLL